MAACFMAAGAHAPPTQPLSSMVADYRLISSTTAPDGNWKFTKARLAVSRLDDRHLLIRMACEWEDSPKEACGDWWTAQMRNDGLYLQDTNTESLAMRFDPATRTWTLIRHGYDVAGTVRTDVFGVDEQPDTDPALMRRMKKAQSSFDASIKLKSFGHYGKWDYKRAQISFSAK